VSGLTIIEKSLPLEELEVLYREADIFVAPAHTVPSKTLVQAMSYELAIVMTDVWSAPEILEDGRTGILMNHPTAHTFSDGYVVHFDSPAYRRALATVNLDLVRQTVEKVNLLIQDSELRRRIGRAARREVEEGKFSLHRRNATLKRVLDEATADSGVTAQHARGA
jgi:glycosyltransferase involved in cell wall biosynthesis